MKRPDEIKSSRNQRGRFKMKKVEKERLHIILTIITLFLIIWHLSNDYIQSREEAKRICRDLGYTTFTEVNPLICIRWNGTDKEITIEAKKVFKEDLK